MCGGDRARKGACEREVGSSHLDELEHIMISLLNALLPHGEALFSWPRTAVRYIMQTAERGPNLQTVSRPCSRRARGTHMPLLFLAIGAGPSVSLQHALSVSGECESFTSAPTPPHPTVRNNLQHCWALCHLTLHGQNSQPLQGLNKGLRAWKQ